MTLKTVIGKNEQILIKRLIFQLQSSAFFSHSAFYNGLQFAFVGYIWPASSFVFVKIQLSLVRYNIVRFVRYYLHLSDISFTFVRYCICIFQISHLHLSFISFAFVIYLICICQISFTFFRYIICICQISDLHLSDISFAFVGYLIC